MGLPIREDRQFDEEPWFVEIDPMLRCPCGLDHFEAVPMFPVPRASMVY